ncbi:MAG: hypothetical protein ACYDBB_18115 [Armatimonadota bacterium]
MKFSWRYWLRRWWFWLGIVVLGVFCWQWLARPPELALVNRCQILQATGEVYRRFRGAGVVLYDCDKKTATCVRWNGKTQWTVKLGAVPLPDGHTSNLLKNIFRHAVVSADLRMLAIPYAARTGGDRLLVCCDGRTLGTVPLSGYSLCSPMVDATDAIWCLAGDEQAVTVLRVKGARITARGVIPTPPKGWTFRHTATRPTFSDTDGVMMSPDGAALVVYSPAQVTYYSVNIAHGTIRLLPAYAIANPPNTYSPRPHLPSSDKLLLPNGDCYDAQGRVTKADGWEYARLPMQADPPSADVLVQTRGAHWRIRNPASGQAWILKPGTGRTLAPRVQDMDWNEPDGMVCGVTPDGRYALTARCSLLATKFPGRETIIAALQKLPPIEQLYNKASYQVTFSVYERPGRLRARSAPWWISGGALAPGVEETLNGVDFCFAPDGHTLHVLAIYGESGKQQYEMLVYRW